MATGQLLMPSQFRRLYAGSLDLDGMFKTKVEMDAYLTNPRSYVSQISACLETQKAYILTEKNGIRKWNPIGDGVSVYENYSKLPLATTITNDTIVYCVRNYTTETNPPITHKKGFYYCGERETEWVRIEEDQYENWKPNTRYNIGDLVLHNNKKVQCIESHTSGDTYEEHSFSFMEVYNKYYTVTQAQYDYLVSINAINESTNDFYIITDAEKLINEYDEIIEIESNMWEIEHNICKYPTHVYAWDDQNDEIVLHNINYISDKKLTISFGMPIKGRVKIIR